MQQVTIREGVVAAGAHTHDRVYTRSRFQYIAMEGMVSLVILPSGVAGSKGQGYRGTVLNCQFTGRLRAQRIVGGHIIATVHHLEICAVCAIGVCTHQSTACGRVSDCSRLTSCHIGEDVLIMSVL